MKMTDFDPSMTYWQSLRIVARGLVQWPLNRYEFDSLVDGLKYVCWGVLCPIVRVLMLLILPLSAPLLTLLVQYERRKTAKQREAAKKRMREQLHSAAQDKGGDK